MNSVKVKCPWCSQEFEIDTDLKKSTILSPCCKKIMSVDSLVEHDASASEKIEHKASVPEETIENHINEEKTDENVVIKPDEKFAIKTDDPNRELSDFERLSSLDWPQLKKLYCDVKALQALGILPVILGVTFCLILLADLFLPFMPSTSKDVAVILFSVLAVMEAFCIVPMIFFLRCRSMLAKFICFLLGLVGVSGSIHLALHYGFFPSLISVVISISLISASGKKLLWGSNRLSTEQIVRCYQCRKKGSEYTVADCPPAKHFPPLWDKILSILMIIWLLIGVVASLVSPSASDNIVQRGVECVENGDYAEAVRHFRSAAEHGHSEGQFLLGKCYYNGQGVEQNYVEAVKYFRLAAEQGHIKARYNLGLCYYNGQGVERNYIEAVRHFRSAADKNDAYAQYMLGLCYEYGFGVTKDQTEAVKYYRLAAAQEFQLAVDALRRLGL